MLKCEEEKLFSTILKISRSNKLKFYKQKSFIVGGVGTDL